MSLDKFGRSFQYHNGDEDSFKKSSHTILKHLSDMLHKQAQMVEALDKQCETLNQTLEAHTQELSQQSDIQNQINQDLMNMGVTLETIIKDNTAQTALINSSQRDVFNLTKYIKEEVDNIQSKSKREKDILITSLKQVDMKYNGLEERISIIEQDMSVSHGKLIVASPQEEPSTAVTHDDNW